MFAHNARETHHGKVSRIWAWVPFGPICKFGLAPGLGLFGPGTHSVHWPGPNGIWAQDPLGLIGPIWPGTHLGPLVQLGPGPIGPIGPVDQFAAGVNLTPSVQI